MSGCFRDLGTFLSMVVTNEGLEAMSQEKKIDQSAGTPSSFLVTGKAEKENDI